MLQNFYEVVKEFSSEPAARNFYRAPARISTVSGEGIDLLVGMMWEAVRGKMEKGIAFAASKLYLVMNPCF